MAESADAGVFIGESARGTALDTFLNHCVHIEAFAAGDAFGFGEAVFARGDAIHTSIAVWVHLRGTEGQALALGEVELRFAGGAGGSRGGGAGPTGCVTS